MISLKYSRTISQIEFLLLTKCKEFSQSNNEFKYVVNFLDSHIKNYEDAIQKINELKLFELQKQERERPINQSLHK